MPRYTRSWTALFLCSCALVAHAHDWWIIADPPRPEPGHAIRFEIGGGHAFPESDTLLAERLLYSTFISGPSGRTDVEFSAGALIHEVTASLDAPGLYRAVFLIQRPGDDKPIITGTTLLPVGGVDNASEYAHGEGLEIVPLTRLSDWQPGGDVAVEVRWNGTVVPALIRLERATGRSIRMRSAPDRPAVFTRWIKELVLFITEHQGQTATLTIIQGE